MRKAFCFAALAFAAGCDWDQRVSPSGPDKRPGLARIADPILKPSYPDRDYLDVDRVAMVIKVDGQMIDDKAMLRQADDEGIACFLVPTTRVKVWEDPECYDQAGPHDDERRCPPHPDSQWRHVKVQVVGGENAGKVGWISRSLLRPE